MSSMFAQNAENPFAASLKATALDYQGPVTGQLLEPGNMSVGVQVGTHVYLSPAMNFSLQAGLSPRLKMPFGDVSSPSLFDANTLFRFKFYNGRMMSERAFFGPYVASGFGMASLSNNWQPYLPIAAGMRLRMSEFLSLNLESMFRQGFGQNYSSLQHSFGFTFVVPEKVEEEQPEPAPKPRRPVRDVVAKRMEPSYEADSDGDGIADSKDSCPDEMGLIQFGGCPYSDAQSGDAPPAIASSIEEVHYDAAPADPDAIARVASVKAAEKAERAARTLDASDVFFEVNKDEISVETAEVLDYVATYLKENPNARLRLRGHADATGSERENKLLSVKRAFSVKRYLAYEKGIALARIESDGLGEASPIADNETDNGRARNRRVELQIE
jgi:outer membrane protein OmpA-like peptidoglycan-associated protein